MKRLFTNLLTAMAMLAVAILSAFVTMRIAIHGREVEVPALAGLTLPQASHVAGELGLSLQLENRFYSTTTASGHILGQFPAPGATVRREWPIRITESLGPQQVSVPDVVGKEEHPASLDLRKAALEVGTIASIPAPGSSNLIIAQTPPPNAEGVDRPTVSLLLSAPASSAQESVVTPSFAGLSFGAAQARAAAWGLRVYGVSEVPPAAPTPAPAAPAYHDSFFVGQTTAPVAAPAPPPSPTSESIVTTQSPWRATGSSAQRPSALCWLANRTQI